MKAPFLENQRVRLSLLDLSNYEHLLSIANQDKLVQFSPSKIDKPHDLKAYVQTAIDGYYHKTMMLLLFLIKKQMPMQVAHVSDI